MTNPDFDHWEEDPDTEDNEFAMDIPAGSESVHDDDNENEEHGPDSTIVEQRGNHIPLVFQSVYTDAVTDESGNIKRLDVSDEYRNQGYPATVAIGNRVTVKSDVRSELKLLFHDIPIETNAKVVRIALPGEAQDPLACVEVQFDIFYDKHTSYRTPESKTDFQKINDTHAPRFWFRPDQLKFLSAL